MQYGDILLAGLTVEEIQIIDKTIDLKDLPEKSPEIYYEQDLCRLCYLVNERRQKELRQPNERENFFEILQFISLFPNFQEDKWKNIPFDLLFQKCEQFKSEIDQLFNRVQQRVNRSDKQHPYEILLNKLRLNALNVLSFKILPQLEKTIEQINDAFKTTVWQNDFSFDITTSTLKSVYEFSPEKEWLDLAPSYYYFDSELASHPLVQYSDSIKKLDHVSNQQEIISWLEQRKQGLLPLNDPEIQKLKKMMEQYDLIDKTDPAKVYLRHRRLIQISNLVQNIIINDNSLTQMQKEMLQEINKTVIMKGKYLRKVTTIPLQAEKRAFRTAHVEGKPLVVDKKEDLIDLDPAHREGAGYLYNRWLEMVEVEDKVPHSKRPLPNLWMWMEGLPRAEVSKLEKDKRYGVPQTEKLVTIQGGKCYNQRCSNREDALIADGIYLFNIDKNNDLYILPSPVGFGLPGKWGTQLRGKGIKETDVQYNHNSVLNGESVKCAGCVCFVDGKIVHIDTNSGHYLPRMDHLQDAIKNALLPQNVFAEDAVVSNYDGTLFESVSEFVGSSSPKLGK